MLFLGFSDAWTVASLERWLNLLPLFHFLPHLVPTITLATMPAVLVVPSGVASAVVGVVLGLVPITLLATLIHRL